MKVTTGVNRLIRDLRDLGEMKDGEKAALSALARRLAEIIDNPETPLSNIDRVSKELRFCITALRDEDYNPKRGISESELDDLLGR